MPEDVAQGWERHDACQHRTWFMPEDVAQRKRGKDVGYGSAIGSSDMETRLGKLQGRVVKIIRTAQGSCLVTG
eukprot:20198-Chlamydomonas_euryale.AAC.2